MNDEDKKMIGEYMKLINKQIDDINGIVSELPNKHHSLIASHYLELNERLEKLESWLQGEECMRKDLRDYCMDRLGSAINPPNDIDVFGRLSRIESLIDIDKIEKMILDGANLHATILKYEERMKELERKLEFYNPLHEAHANSHHGIDKEIRRLIDRVNELASKDIVPESVSVDTKKLYTCKQCGFHRFMIYAQVDKIIGECEKCKAEWVD